MYENNRFKSKRLMIWYVHGCLYGGLLLQTNFRVLEQNLNNHKRSLAITFKPDLAITYNVLQIGRQVSCIFVLFVWVRSLIKCFNSASRLYKTRARALVLALSTGQNSCCTVVSAGVSASLVEILSLRSSTFSFLYRQVGI